jgi:hypothetical protein
VSVDDGVAIRKPLNEPGLATESWARNMDEADPGLLDNDHAFLRQQLAQGELVGVAPDRLDRRAERLQLLERGDRRDVAGVKDQVGRPEQVEALVRQPPRAARQVGVGDDCDPRQPTPFRNFPSR